MYGVYLPGSGLITFPITRIIPAIASTCPIIVAISCGMGCCTVRMRNVSVMPGVDIDMNVRRSDL